MLNPTPTAALFPGQGSHVDGMRDAVAETRPDLLAAVCELVGDDPFERVDESTRFAQPAIFCASLTGWSRIRELVSPVAMAGHSLGEITALTAAGAVDEHDALGLVVLRGRLTAEAGEASGGGTMLALVGASPSRAAALAARHDVIVANDNSPDQVVLSGPSEKLADLESDAGEEGFRTRMLDVPGAFHSPQMEAAVAPFREALANVEFKRPEVQVFSCATAQPFSDPQVELAAAITAPVRWRDTMSALDAEGIATFIDLGPGRVLAKLARRCVAGAATAVPDVLLEPENASR